MDLQKIQSWVFCTKCGLFIPFMDFMYFVRKIQILGLGLELDFLDF